MSALHWPHRGLGRRDFLVASTTGLAGVTSSQLFQPAVQAESSVRNGSARSTILFFLCGGISHIDTWDMKPHAAAEFRGDFQPIATSAPGITLCEHLPLVAKQAHHLALINSVSGTVNTNDHHCLLYTSDAADDSLRVDLGGRRIIKKIFFQAEDGIRDCLLSRGLGDVYKRQVKRWPAGPWASKTRDSPPLIWWRPTISTATRSTPVSYTHLTLPTTPYV